MKLLVVSFADQVDRHAAGLAAVRETWEAQGKEYADCTLDGEVVYADLLDVVLAEQAEAVLVVAGDDHRVGLVSEVMWKFDSAIRVASLAPLTSVEGVLAAGGDTDGVVAVLSGDSAPHLGPPASSRALLVGRGWVYNPRQHLRDDAIKGVRELIETPQALSFSDETGYRHVVGSDLVRLLVPLLDDAPLGVWVGEALGPDVWLGAVEALLPEGGGLRRELARERSETESPTFRPGGSLLVALDEQVIVDVDPGSQRLLACERTTPASLDRTVLSPGEAVMVEAGCRFGVSAKVVHLRFTRLWMKPDVLFGGALGDVVRQLGSQARQWCGTDVGLAMSVDEFLSIEEATLSGGVGQRKGSGI